MSSATPITLSGEALRDYTIAEADRMRHTILVQIGGFEELRAEAQRTVEQMKGVLEAANTALASATAAQGRAAEYLERLNRELTVVMKIGAKLQADKDAGTPAADGTMTILYG